MEVEKDRQEAARSNNTGGKKRKDKRERARERSNNDNEDKDERKQNRQGRQAVIADVKNEKVTDDTIKRVMGNRKDSEKNRINE